MVCMDDSADAAGASPRPTAPPPRWTDLTSAQRRLIAALIAAAEAVRVTEEGMDGAGIVPTAATGTRRS